MISYRLPFPLFFPFGSPQCEAPFIEDKLSFINISAAGTAKFPAALRISIQYFGCLSSVLWREDTAAYASTLTASDTVQSPANPLNKSRTEFVKQLIPARLNYYAMSSI